jgi:hypothetical protein
VLSFMASEFVSSSRKGLMATSLRPGQIEMPGWRPCHDVAAKSRKWACLIRCSLHIDDREQQDIGGQGAGQRQDRFAPGVLRRFGRRLWREFQGVEDLKPRLMRAIAPN